MKSLVLALVLLFTVSAAACDKGDKTTEAEVHYQAADGLAGEGKSREAIAEYDLAISLNPKHVDAYVNRGGEYGILEEYDKAIADFTKALEFEPADELILGNRGLAYAFTGDYEKALADYAEAIRLAPVKSTAYENRAMVYTMQGQDTAAEADVEKAVELGASLDALNKRIEIFKLRREKAE